MSLISTFISNQLLKTLEDEFVKHAPDLQEAFVEEVADFATTVINWATSKMAGSQQPKD